MNYRTLALILRQHDWSEDSQLFYFYTQRYGKLVALGRGTKKIESKLNSHLQRFSIIDLSFARGRNFDHITSAIMTETFGDLKTDYRAVVYASYGLELVDRLTAVYDPEPAIFDLLIDYCATIEKKRAQLESEGPLVKRRFIVKLLTLSGYEPDQATINDDVRLHAALLNTFNQELKTEKFFKQLT